MANRMADRMADISTTEVFNCILEKGEPWLQYAVRVNHLKEGKGSLKDLRTQALSEPNIKAYLQDLASYHDILVRNHKNPDLPIHKLLFLLDLGFDANIPEIQAAIEKIQEHKDNNGVYKSLTNIPKHFGGSGEDSFAWCLCDAPLLLLALVKSKVDYEKHIKQGVDYLVGIHRDIGFPCAVSPELGRFRGPGRKDDPCPYASLLMLKLLCAIPEHQNSDVAASTAKCLLDLWENSAERHPYMFYMGTDFRKLKAPAMWYDIVSVADVLSQIEPVRDDPRFKELLSLIKSKQDKNGLFTPESVYQKLNGWDFGQKKAPSLYLTYLCCRILEQAS